jgi:hypothetical protein
VNGPFIHDRYVSELQRKYNLGAKDAQSYFTATALVRQEQYRFLDPVYNTSTRLHALPLVSPPKAGATLRDIPDFGVAKPLVEINKDDRSGTPATVDHVITRVVQRTDEQVVAILGSLGSAARFSGKQSDYAGSAPRPTMVPLFVKVA